MKKYEFEPITIRQEISTRGGGIEISLDTLGFPGEKMAAYQNYLGGGILGRIMVNDTLDSHTAEDAEKLADIGDQLKSYFHDLTNPKDEWESMSYEKNQLLPISAY